MNKYDAMPNLIQEAIDAIGDGFSWAKTPQGLEYWEEVTQNLEKLLDEVQPLKQGATS